ncbi:MAG: cobaltochelatase subunit CobN, partial [Euryarchaeota archaeon]
MPGRRPGPSPILLALLLTFTVVNPASGVSLLQGSAHRLVVVTGYWSVGLPAARAASGLPVTVVVEDAVSRGLVPPDAVRDAILRADALLLIHTRSNPILGSILENLPEGTRVLVYDNVLPAPAGARDLEEVTVRWNGVPVPLSLYVQSRSERNFRSLLEYLLTGRPGPFHPFDGWVEGYDYERDSVVRPEDPSPGELREAVDRYGSGTVYLGSRAYPRWFIELLRSRLSGLIRSVLSRESGRKGPSVLILCDTTTLECGWTAPLRELCRALVERGLNPLVLALHYDLLDGDPESVLRALSEVIREMDVQAVIFLAGLFRMRAPDSPEVGLLKTLGVPVIKAVRLGHTMTEWQAYWRVPSGLDWSALYHVVIPENLGMIEGIPISVREWRRDGPGPLLGRVWRMDTPIPPMIRLLADRVAAWVRLRLKPNAEKRVVILYWAAEPGKEGVGIASSLDVPASIVNFLAWLLARGYRVEIPREFVEYLRRFADEVPRDSPLYPALSSGSPEGALRSVRETLLEINRLETEAERLARRGEWKRALELYLRAYRLIRPLADALGRLMVEEGSNIGAYILRRLQCSGGRLYLELLAYESGRFVRKRWEVRYVYLLPLDEYERWYRSLPEETRLCVEKGVFGYLETLLRFVRRYGPVMDPVKLRALTNGLRSLVAYVEGHLQYLQLSDRERREFLSDLRSLVEATVSALTDPDRADEALRRCEELYRKWSRVEALYGWFTGWGPPERSRYLVEVDGRRYFVIRGIRFGNVLVAPQPARGYYVGISVAYHSTILPPCHYYLACYYYFTRVFRADVIVNTGKHGTYEWLPYKPLFMSWWDFPQVCIQDVPQVYPYYVADPSEALVAKRRGWAVLVNYLPESLARCELGDEWGELLELLREYLSSGLSVYRARILELVKKTRAYELLNLSSLGE